MMDEAEFDALLRRELAPPEGPADLPFVARVDRTLAEAERYRLARAALRRELASHGLAAAALAGSAALLADAPPVRAALAQAPSLGGTMAVALLLCWLLIARARFGSLA